MEKLPQIIHSSWHEHLQPLFDDPKLAIIKDSILPAATFYPEKKDIFKVFSMPLEDIKVVILGQDPYPKSGQAIGLAFAVDALCPMPASLKIIHKEVFKETNDLKLDNETSWKTLNHWTNQGVFLLNTALTVKAGEAGSHVKYWQWFTREIIRIVSIFGNKPVWLLWGAKAKAYKGLIHKYYTWHGDYKGLEYNYVLDADHPAAETFPDPKGKFSGCNHFNIANDILAFKGQSKIQW
jgi:uracil-DNA glycosylase